MLSPLRADKTVAVPEAALFALGAAAGLAVAAVAGLFSVVSADRTAPEAEFAASPIIMERLDAPGFGRREYPLREFARAEGPARKPLIAVVIDDLGLSEAAYARAQRLPGPITLSILPYGERAVSQALSATAAGYEVIAHVPLEPDGNEDAGPGALRVDQPTERLRALIAAHVRAVPGAVGANGHMGSRFTADRGAMRILIEEIDRRGLLFLDSRTTAETAALQAAADVGARILTRDVFLDDADDREAIKEQLRALESLAMEQGFAVAIAHPRVETVAALGPWLATAPSRGFELVTLTELAARTGSSPALVATTPAPALR